MRLRFSSSAFHFLLAALVALLAVVVSYTALGLQFDNNLNDFIFRLAPTHRADCGAALLEFDERTLLAHGGIRGLRRTLAQALDRLAAAPPAVVAIDLTLADQGDPADDAALEAAFARTPRLVLASEMMADGSAWQDPIPRFRSRAAAVGHVHALAGPTDDINRRIALERVAGRTRRWALSLEAFRLSRNEEEIDASPADLMVGATTIVSRWDEGRPMRVRYRPDSSITRLSLDDVIAGRGLETLRGKVVFIGVTAQSGVGDRLFTPLSGGLPTPGVLIHLEAFETIAARDFLYDTPLIWALLAAVAIAAAAAALFAFTQGAASYAGALTLLAFTHLLPWLLFRRGLVLAPFAPLAAAWLGVGASGAFEFFFVRRRLRASEARTARYQQAFHFVAHEMRTPLTAIQGSSELMARYNLPEPKRKELGQMINAESKRLARMITTFLDVEKLSAGQMDLRLVDFELQQLIDTCYQRAMPLAERKQIRVLSDIPEGLSVRADRELLEYAVYNLLTNAIKYSAPESDVIVTAQARDSETRLSVRDHGMGMDATEVKNLFRKFYRTRRAEQSGEVGTGLGLSIVREIVLHHGGRIDVESRPGEGSTFTVVLPATIH